MTLLTFLSCIQHLSTEVKMMTSLIAAFAWRQKPLGSLSKRSNFSVQVWTPWKLRRICFRLKTQKFATYIFTDTILKPSGSKISGVTSFMNVVNIGNLAPALASEASSDRAKFCCVVAALFALQYAIKISREVQAAVLTGF